MSRYFEGINRGLSVEPVAYGVVVEFVGLSCKVDSILSESVVDFGELAPISGLPCTSQILVRHYTNVNLLNRIFKLIHEYVIILFVNGDLLVLVNSDEGESDSLNI